MNKNILRSEKFDTILAKIKQNVSIPHDASESLPAQSYVSQSFLSAEKEKIFKRDWICVGREMDAPKTGDYFTFEIADNLIFIIRDEKQKLRSYANICRHRLARLLKDKGNVKSIVCPYHAWTYNLDGSLRGAPFMGKDFDKSKNSLHELQLEVWFGFIFVSLDPKAKHLSEQLNPLKKVILNYRVAEMIPIFRANWTWNTNWKVMLENFMDPLHVFHVHKKTIEPILPTKNQTLIPGGSLYSLYLQTRKEDVDYEYNNQKQLNSSLTEKEKSTYPVFCVYPGLLVGVAPDRVVWFSIQPEGTDKIRIVRGIDVFPGLMDGKNAPDLQEILNTFKLINDEDKEVTESVQINARSSMASSGKLATKELPIWEFQRFLVSRLS